ncbi:DUF1311 domain-containing protein [Rhodobacterales bacterium]|nr:DUF1311 domain-containing protein [Rhodobacterales bacterium]
MISWPFIRTVALFFIFVVTGSQAQAFSCDDEDLIFIFSRSCQQYELYKKYEVEDGKLNEIYKELQKNAKEYDREIEDKQNGFLLSGMSDALRDTQRAWIKFRDEQCGLARFGWTHVQDRDFMETKCLYEITIQRTQELKLINEEL